MEEPKVKKSQWAKIKNSKKLPVLFSVVFLALLVLGAFGIYLLQNQKSEERGPVVFKIEEVEYFQSDIDRLIIYPTQVGGLSKEYATQYAFEQLKKIQAAEKAGATPPQEIIDEYVTQATPSDVADDSAKLEEYKDWFSMLGHVQAIESKLDSSDVYGYKGYSHIFYFGQHIEYGDDYTPEGLNNPDLIKEDKEYAKSRADFYHQQLTEGKITNGQIEQEVKADPKLKTFVTTKNPFGSEDPLNWEQDIYYKSVIDYIKSGVKTGISDVQVGSGIPGPDINDSPVEIYYYFVDIQTSPNSKALSSVEFYKILNELNSEYYIASDNSYPFTANNVSNVNQQTEDISGAEN